jgi:hypothetical protein
MQQYQNPNFYGQQFMQPQFNPYLQRMENLQQFQQAINPPVMQQQMPTQTFNPFGKIVESMDVVKVTDIPMDGNMYYFPQADGQAIYGKKFLPNGQTQILAYKPILDDNPNTLSNDDEKLKFDLLERVTDLLQENISSVNDRLDKIEKYLKPTSKKKEVDE